MGAYQHVWAVGAMALVGEKRVAGFGHCIALAAHAIPPVTIKDVSTAPKVKSAACLIVALLSLDCTFHRPDIEEVAVPIRR